MIDIDLNDVPEIIARKNERGISFKVAALEINAGKRVDAVHDGVRFGGGGEKQCSEGAGTGTSGPLSS